MHGRLGPAALVVGSALAGACAGPHTPAQRVAREFRAADSLTYELEVEPSFHRRRRVVVRMRRWDSAFSALAITYTLPDSSLSQGDLMAPILRIDTTTRGLSGPEWAALERALDVAQFWTLQPRDPDPVVRPDATVWRLRATAGSRTRIVERYSPDSLFVTAALLMLRLVGVADPSALGQ